MGKGVILFSGGLDSILAAKLLMDQGIDMVGFHCVSPFVSQDTNLDNTEAGIAAKNIGLKLFHYRLDKGYLDMVKNPEHGYGKRMNPCIDCKIYFLQKATEYMEKIGADFIATGEVVGQRPMSQLKNTMNHIHKSSNLKGKLLRPLSAKILEPTAVEESGLVDREKLLDISGRGRGRQIELADKFGIKEYSSPAGGCYFTDEFIANRVRDLFKYNENYSATDFYLLTVGRHFRLSESIKALVGRNQGENESIETNIEDRILGIPQFTGPSSMIYGDPSDDELQIVASLMVRYGKGDSGSVEFIFPNGEKRMVEVANSMKDEDIEKIRI